MSGRVEPPIPESYLVAERLLAGEYPGAPDQASAERRLRAFAVGGVTTFVDLTHPADALACLERADAIVVRRDAARYLAMSLRRPHWSRRPLTTIRIEE